ncbi:glycosyl hydrolase 2 galactose-binding domain-containing protein [Streptomyces sp. NPDC050121]|uniref:glycosyl hydrolase 2 galactose-binding domain-containing protein n=1 Tax=Streptomyces sp. NPDC050121 TaxID=3365601 RepID=UPI0037905D00
MSPAEPPDPFGAAPDLLATARWTLLGTAPGVVEGPDSLPRKAAWIPARVPGTAADAVRRAYGERKARAEDYDGQDWWWRCVVDLDPRPAGWWLALHGLATIADVWVAGEHVAHSRNMFRSVGVPLEGLAGPTEVVVRCAASTPVVAGRRRPRPRWKSPLVTHQAWRHLRTSLLGRAPGWPGGVAVVGPWRPLTLAPLDRPVVVGRRLRTRLEGSTGILDADIFFAAPTAASRSRVHVKDVVVDCEAASPTHHTVSVRLPGVRRWWPHSHGDQPLYPVEVEADGVRVLLGRVGFRTVEATDGDGAFGLRVNGVPVFVAGTCWMPPDPFSVQTPPETAAECVRQAREAGFNLIRLVGGTLYEEAAFHDACDQLGMLVWQDCMLATLDPPDDDDFAEELAAEVSELADRLGGRPSTAVVSGGNETEQQPVLLGLPSSSWEVRAVTEIIPKVLRSSALDVPYVTSTPMGGGFPSHPRAGIAHYFGVGAYLRPLSDIRVAGVRFAAECLAFSIPPEEQSVLRAFGGAHVAGHHPEWKAAVPRDRTASWDFEDVRDHYVGTLLGVDPAQVRRTDPERYLDLGRAAVCAAMTEVLSQWRRPRDPCSGAVVLALRDLLPGAGWGLVDAYGRPKAPWYAVRRVLAPTAILVHDEGLNGTTVTVVNDTATPLAGNLTVRSWTAQGMLLDDRQAALTVAARGATEIDLDRFLGVFTDVNHAYRFGPRTREVLHLAFTAAADDSVLAEQVVLLDGRALPARRGGLRGTLRYVSGNWQIAVTADELAQWVVVSAPGYRAEDSWFHMAPGTTRSLRLTPEEPSSAVPPAAVVRALNVQPTSAASADAYRDA